YDGNEAALDAVMREWTSGRTFASRVANLVDGSGSALRLNGTTFLNDSTVHDDGDRDVLTGDAGLDWFLLNLDRDGGAGDCATDGKRTETVTDIDFLAP